jgi:hypothetical protein
VTEHTPWGIDRSNTVGGVTKPTNDKKSLADPGATHVELRFYPYKDETQAVVVVAHGLGDRARRLRVWSGVLPCGRESLRGLDAGRVTLLLTDHLRAALAYPTGDPVGFRDDTSGAAAPAPPLGATGGNVALPGL